jgi:hypothetical protein
VGNNQNRFLYSSCAPNPTHAVPDRKSIIAEALVSALARLYKNIATHFCLNPSKTLSVAEKSVQSRLSLSPAFARREGQNIFSKEIGRCDLIHAIVGIIRSRIKEGVSASTMKQQGKYAKYDIHTACFRTSQHLSYFPGNARPYCCDFVPHVESCNQN